MILNRHRHLTPANSAHARAWNFSRHTLVWQLMMIAGLFSLTSALWNTFSATAHAAPPNAIVAALENARHDLEISTAQEARISVELEKLKQSGQTPSDVITDYEAYLERVRAMVAENRRLVQQLEALLRQSTFSTSSQQASEADALQSMIEAPIPEDGVTGEVADLDRELDASLAEFDDMLLEELKLIREKSSPKIDSLAQEAADAAQRLREKGIDIDADPSESDADADASREQTASETQSEKSPTGSASDASGRTDDSGLAATSTSSTVEGIEGDPKKQAERYDGSDDDIVARQLREAAEQESDPVLKEKLWKEYEAYKRDGG